MRERVRATLGGYARAMDPRRLGGDYSVVSLCSVALAVLLTVAAVDRATPLSRPLAAGIAGGVTLALAVRLLAADRTAAMPVGGAAAPVGTAAALAAPAVWGLRGDVSGAGIAVGGTVLGFGCGLVVGQSFADGRVRRAASRLVIATVAVVLAAVVSVAALAGEMGTLVDAVGGTTAAIGRELGSTSRPLSTAGPTLFIAAAGLISAGSAVARLSIPTVLTDETRSTVRELADRWARGLRRAGLVALVLGSVLTLADAAGILAGVLAGVPPLRVLVTFVGSGPARALAVGLVLLSLGSLLATALLRWAKSLTFQQVTVATLPTVGLLAGGAAIAVALVSVPALDLELIARAVPGLYAGEDVEGVAVVVAFAAVIASTVLVTGLYLLRRAIDGRTPGVTLVSVGVAAVGVVVLVAASSPIAGFALFALAVFVADVGSYGWTVGSEVGRRSGARMEVLHGLASGLVGAVGVAVALSLVGVATAGGQALSPLNYAIGAAAVAVVFLTVGRQLSAR
ncbi:hypothetical protein [Halomicrobium urmianum]|uniref:hypothetical protein n=1 Tax=Halomicrobium urmianum TaxID=1586233 RepID=UPI001CDA3ECD|nr:hypothetical protein [Halomicrobium urmianum]